MQMVQRRGDKSSSDGEPAILESADDWKKQVPVSKISRLGGVLCFIALYMVLTSASGKTTRMESPTSTVGLRTKLKESKTTNINFMDEYLAFEKAFEKYDNCVVSYVPPTAKAEWDTKPLWLTAFPGSGTTGASGKGDIFKPLINAMVRSLKE